MPKRFFFRRPPKVIDEHRLPDGERVYAVGDVHGHLGCLDRIEAKIVADISDRPPIGCATVIFLGDYIDRGDDSRGVIERLTSRRFAGLPARFLIGNHEDAMLHFLASPRDSADWLSFGGAATLASYGIRVGGSPAAGHMSSLAEQLGKALPESHLQFLRDLELFILIGDFLFVHAGIRPNVALQRQTRRDMLTIREPFLSHHDVMPWRVVHGHTIVDVPTIARNKISLDTGAYATGSLTCAAIEGNEVRIL